MDFPDCFSGNMESRKNITESLSNACVYGIWFSFELAFGAKIRRNWCSYCVSNYIFILGCDFNASKRILLENRLFLDGFLAIQVSCGVVFVVWYIVEGFICNLYITLTVFLFVAGILLLTSIEKPKLMSLIRPFKTE